MPKNVGHFSSVMPRPVLVPRQYPICHICDTLAVRRPRMVKTYFSIKSVPGISIPWPHILQHVQTGARSTAPRMLQKPDRQTRCLVSTISTGPGGKPANGHQRAGSHQRPSAPETTGQELSSLTNMMVYLENSKSKVLGHRKIPSEADTSAALQACKVVADYIMDESVQPQITHMINELDSTASNLLSLDRNGSKAWKSSLPDSTSTGGVGISAQLEQMIDKISDTAYEILAQPAVFITPSLLQQYVNVQARLGKPETLPRVFQLYASKPMPREASGITVFVKQNPNKIANAIEPEVVETALDTAIEAKNLDAAVGIIENSYATNAFIRSKLIRKAGVPAATFAVTPIAAYGLASNLSVLQDSLDPAFATNIAFAGILAYVTFTASIGIVAVTTANDQMKRVTWTEGIPLRNRWMFEEQRAALDKVACAWGFKDESRWSEESGHDWDVLRSYLLHKGMLLDDPRLMAGME